MRIFYGLMSFAVAFFAVSLFYYFSSQPEDSGSNEPVSTNNEETNKTEDNASEETTEKDTANTSDVNIDAITNNNCLSCHAISSIGVEGANTGPDLSKAYSTVESKHGKKLDEFLKEPTSAVMSTVIGDNPLSDEDRESIVKALKEADEK